jgi:hypothetical protein
MRVMVPKATHFGDNFLVQLEGAACELAGEAFWVAREMISGTRLGDC